MQPGHTTAIALQGVGYSPQTLATQGLWYDVTINILPPVSSRIPGETGGKIQKRIRRPTWRDIDLNRDDAEVVELVTILFMSDIL